MDVEFILAICFSINKMAKTARTNKELCRQLAEKVKGVEELVLTTKQRGPGQVSPAVEKALRELYSSLEQAKALMMKSSQAKGLKNLQNHEEKFNKMNERLTSNFQLLSGALQKEHMNMLHDMYDTVSQRTPGLRPNNRSMSFPAPTATTPESYTMPASTLASPAHFSYMMPPNSVPIPTAQTPAPYMFPPPAPSAPLAAPYPIPAMPMPVPMLPRETVFFPPTPAVTIISSSQSFHNSYEGNWQ